MFAEGLEKPFGIAFYPSAEPRYVYVGAANQVVRYPYKAGDRKATAPAEVIIPDMPRTVVLGKRALAGHHLYRNAVGKGNRTVQDVYVLSHFRINGVTRVRFDGEWKTLGGTEDAERGFQIQGIDAKVWVKVHKGALDHVADPGLVARANPSDRWTVDHRLAGLAYAVVTNQLVRDKLSQPCAGVADKLAYFSGTNTLGLTDLKAGPRALLGLTAANGKIPVFTGASTAAMRDIVGTVSQSAGVPTGAIVERGSNGR